MNIPIPGLGSSIGLGDVIEKVTAAVGIPTCGGCQKRKEAANALQFTPRKKAEPEPVRRSYSVELPEGYRLLLQGQRDGDTQVLLSLSTGGWSTFLLTEGPVDEHKFTTQIEAQADFTVRMRTK